MDLRERFRDLWKRVKAKGDPDKVFDQLVSRYSETHRYYHNLDHWQFGLEQLDLIREVAERPDLIELAWAFHDSIYVIGKSDNEEQSCRLAIKTIKKAGLDGGKQVLVGALIMTTKHNEVPISTDQRIIVDMDLAILGQAPEVFDQYERNVRAEYQSVDDETFWAVRKGILQGFLDRRQIYSTSRFQVLYADQACENLKRTIAQH